MKRYNDRLKEEFLTGGKADEKTTQDIADKHGVDLSVIEDQVSKGLNIEKEHTNDEAVALEIACDHLWENPYYYDALIDMEKEFE